MPPVTPSTTMICGKPRPTSDMMVSNNSSPGKRHPGVDEALHRQVQSAAMESRDAADQHRHHDVDGGRRQTGGQRNSGPEDEAAQHVAPQLVGRQQIPVRRGLHSVNDEFDAAFAGTDFGQEPTGERSRYVTLRFNFPAVNDKLETLEREFETYCFIELRGTLRRHPDLSPEAARDILTPPAIATKLAELFRYAGDHDIPLYVLIDEYDNFANTVLAYRGVEAYHWFTHGGGFYRNFFATLKGGADRSGGGLERLFITGVSPITMDDVTSGFNIGKNISLHPDFNEMVGFTEPEVRHLLETYRELGVFNQDPATAMGIMGQWYNGYRFAEEAETDLYNSDMVLYYLDHSIPNRRVPTYLIDTNVRIDYGKLRHLLVVGRQLNGNFDLLRNIIGEERVDVLRIQPSFPLKQLTDEENFLSLLHYFGLLSIREVAGGAPRLGIPNQTVKRLMYGYLRDGDRDVEVFRISPVPVRAVADADGQRGRVAAGVRVPGRGDRPADGDSRLHRRGEGARAPFRGVRFSGGVSELGRLLRVAVGGGAGEGTCGHCPGAAGRPLPAPGARLRPRSGRTIALPFQGIRRGHCDQVGLAQIQLHTSAPGLVSFARAASLRDRYDERERRAAALPSRRSQGVPGVASGN